MKKQIKDKPNYSIDETPLTDYRNCCIVYSIVYNEQDEEEEPVKNSIGEISPIEYDKKDGGFYIKTIYGYSIKNYPRVKYPNKQTAAGGLWSLWMFLKETSNQNKVPDDVFYFINDSLRKTYEENRFLVERKRSFLNSLDSLRYFIEKFNIQIDPMYGDFIYPENSLEKLKNAELSDGRKFFSEDVLYESIGKEDARYILALLNNLINES